MKNLKDMLINVIERFEDEVCHDCRFENIFCELLEPNANHEIIISGDLKSFIDSAIANCDREIAYEQEAYINGDLELCMETLSLYINLKKDLVELRKKIKMTKKERMIEKILNICNYGIKQEEKEVYDKLMNESPLTVAYIKLYLEDNYINEHDLYNCDDYIDMLDYVESELL